MAVILVAAFRADASGHWLWAAVAVGAGTVSLATYLVKHHRKPTTTQPEPVRQALDYAVVRLYLSAAYADTDTAKALYGFRRRDQTTLSDDHTLKALHLLVSEAQEFEAPVLFVRQVVPERARRKRAQVGTEWQNLIQTPATRSTVWARQRASA